MTPSHKTQKASLAAVINMLRHARLEGSKAELKYHADVLDALYARMERAEQAVKAEKEQK